ncbi:MAG: cytochrome b/b6 domain-containing protein [Acidobacteria bacterium]|nr:cytochrome b/b6 domain-containing protein [Acidobacteriota bacterium]
MGETGERMKGPAGAAAGAGSGRVALHSYNVRICHWINVIAGTYLVLSGIHIFLDFPELYWGNTGYQGYPALFRLADWGISWDEAAALGDRMWGRNYHFTFAWVFLLNGVVYVGWGFVTGHLRDQLWPGRAELTRARLAAEIREHLRWRSPARLAATSYGALQKTSYLLLVFVFVPLMTLTGLAQSPGFTAAMPWLLDMFGGRQTARTLHTFGTVVFVLFVVVHVLEVVAAGAVNRIRAMITGTFRSPEEGT